MLAMGEALWNWVFRRIEREWEVICRAPLVFGLALGFGITLVAVGIWFAMWWHYSGTVSALQATIQTLQTGNSQLQDHNTRLQEELRNSRQAAREVAVQPPSWRIQKRGEFLRALQEAGSATLDLNCIQGDRDTARLFGDLHDLFLAGGWTVRNKAQVSGGSWTGVRVVVKNRETASSRAVLLVELLRQNGIFAAIVEYPTHVALTSEIFMVDVGFRP
jgi:hypothetical protein